MTKNILFIDDDPSALLVGELVLTSLGYKVTTATGGHEGISEFKRFNYDIIFLDLMMPDIDGLEVLRVIKNSDKGNNTPVIMQTGASNLTQVINALKEGRLFAVLQKPYTKDDIKRTIDLIT